MSEVIWSIYYNIKISSKKIFATTHAQGQPASTKPILHFTKVNPEGEASDGLRPVIGQAAPGPGEGAREAHRGSEQSEGEGEEGGNEALEGGKEAFEGGEGSGQTGREERGEGCRGEAAVISILFGIF